MLAPNNLPQAAGAPARSFGAVYLLWVVLIHVSGTTPFYGTYVSGTSLPCCAVLCCAAACAVQQAGVCSSEGVGQAAEGRAEAHEDAGSAGRMARTHRAQDAGAGVQRTGWSSPKLCLTKLGLPSLLSHEQTRLVMSCANVNVSGGNGFV